jgi:hypothetical protein
MPQMGFEPTTPVFEWLKTVHPLDSVATVIDKRYVHIQHKAHDTMYKWTI